ncbi:hypothetical protein L7F22_009303 [Adiantum nelumboides]|nr:hypothetical protein [Adiantum nelumboides]
MAGRIFSGGWRRNNLARSLYPTKLCHFCNLASIIVPPHPEEEQQASSTPPESSLTLSTGSESNWFCSRCQCWNRFDEKEEGGMKSWESRMGDESVNSSVRYTSTTSNSIRDRKSIFCHTCQMNQTLVLSMISNYEEEDDIQRFKKWRDDLEKRYPPICMDCRDVIEEQIRKSDKHARALIWNDLLQRRHTRQPADYSSSIDTHQSDSNRHSRNITARSKVDWMWYIGALCFLASWMSEVVVLICVIFHTFLPAPAIQISSIILQCFVSKWDPSIPRQVQFTVSNPGYRAIKIHLPPRVSLKSRESTRSLQVQRGGPDLIHLSLQDEKPDDQKHPKAGRNEDDGGEQEPEEEEGVVDDSMDWSPTLPTRGFSSSNNENKSFSYTFGPRRFFEPVNDTGLEDLLRRNLGLQDSFDDNDNDRVPMDLDMPTDGNAKKGSQRRYIHFAIAFSIVALIVALYLNAKDEENNVIGFITSKFYNTSILLHFSRSSSSFLQPIRQWWSSAFALARQRNPHQALWRPSFEEVANAE